MLWSVSALSVVLSVAVLLTILCNRRIEDTIPLAFGVVIFALYALALMMGSLGLKYIGIIYLMGGFSLLSSVIIGLNRKQKEDIIHNIFTNGLFSYLLFVAFLYFFCLPRKFVYWDEFSHWGLTVKNMYYLDILSVFERSTTDFKTYPPAIALLQYFFVRPQAVFVEGACIFAYDAMMGG